MTLSIRSSFLLGVLALALVLAGSALAGVLPIAPQQARAADETGEETTTTPEEPPPVTETPTEPETTPEPETPTSTPPVTTPPVTAPSGGESGGGTVETPKPTPSTGTATGGSGTVSGGSGTSGGSGSSSGGSTGAGSTGGTTTTSPTTTSPSRNTTRTPTRTTDQRNGGGGRTSTGGSDSNSQTGAGGGGSRNTGGGGATAGHHPPSSAGGGGRAPQPTVSPQAIDEGASAVSHAASHVGEAFAEALPTAPLKKIGDQLAAHIAGAGAAEGGGNVQRQTADQIGTALGAALLGSAVAVDRTPAASSSPLPFFTPPGGKSGTIYLVLIAALLLGVGALVFREARSALGFDKPRTGVRVADEKPRIALGERVGVALAGVHGATHRWFSRARRLRANAAAGLRSLF